METNEDAYRRESYGRGRERVAALVLLAALALLAVLAFAVPQGAEQPTGTEYLLAANARHERTPVGGLIDIEDAWAIEDARNEAGGVRSFIECSMARTCLGMMKEATRSIARWAWRTGRTGPSWR